MRLGPEVKIDGVDSYIAEFSTTKELFAIHKKEVDKWLDLKLLEGKSLKSFEAPPAPSSPSSDAGPGKEKEPGPSSKPESQ